MHGLPSSLRVCRLASDRWRIVRIVGALLVCVVGAGRVGAQGSGETPAATPQPEASSSFAASIAEAALRSADQLLPERMGDVETAQGELLAAIEDLQGYLSETTNEDNAQAWLRYLRIPALVDALDSEQPDVQVARAAKRVAQRATGIDPGLERAAVSRLRQAAETFADALRFRRKESVAKALASQLKRFGAQWENLDGEPTADDLSTLNLLLDLLERTGQEVPLVDAVRQRFGGANVQVTVTEEMVRQAVSRPLQRQSPVRDCILGTRIVGQAWMDGQVTAATLPSADSVRIQLTLDGTVNTRNTGYNGPVRLQSTGLGQAHASRVIEIGPHGVSLQPVSASGQLQTTIQRIEHPLRLVRRIARKKAAQQKPLADQIAERRFVRRIGDDFAEQTRQAFAGRPRRGIQEVQTFLRRLGLEQPQREIGSTADSIFLQATVRQGNQLAAPIAPPSPPGGSQATIQIHETMVVNTLGTLFADRPVRQAELERLFQNFPGADNAAATREGEQADFEVDFDAVRPIVFEAREGRVRLGIRGSRFAQGGRELKRPLEIVATYVPKTTDSGRVILQRQGEAEINFPGRKRLSVSEAGLRGSIKKSLADAFPQRLMDRPWQVPNDAQLAALRGREFVPDHVDAQRGWLTLGVQLKRD